MEGRGNKNFFFERIKMVLYLKEKSVLYVKEKNDFLFEKYFLVPHFL